jgi:hypothetical protein
LMKFTATAAATSPAISFAAATTTLQAPSP